MRALLNSLCNIILMFYIIFDILKIDSIVFILCFIFHLKIDGIRGVTESKKMFFSIMRALLNIVCNIILNVLHFMTI